ncbi:tetratricopeptide repeat protein [Nocardia sp. NPDC005825]|uniref:tetratricopeptide repeat protein n=1 Tax=unclassified Nocardia TaxID=2637762 RepID=UPI0033D209A6
MYELGVLSETADPPDYPAARRWFEKAAAAGESAASFRLGSLLSEKVKPRDYDAAVSWYEKAADSGTPEAMHKLGFHYLYRMYPPDRERARYWYEKDANQGCALADFEVGLLDAADGNLGDAMLRYEKAAAGGQAGAMNNLGLMLERTMTVPNLVAAAEWYERAIAFGDPNAQANLERLRGAAEPRLELLRTVLPETVPLAAEPPSVPETTASTGVTAALDAVLDDSPYLRNPFRLAGLRTDADSRRFRARVTELEASERLGAPVASPGVLPVSPAPETADVRAALNHLRDPVNRLVHELFWIWPADDADPAWDALAAGDLSGAEQIWLSQLEENGIAAHNLAVVRSIQGLESRRGRAPETWLDALTAWDVALAGPALWERLRARARRIDERRLNDSALAELRRALPAAVLRLHAAQLVHAAKDDDAATTMLHIDVLTRFGEQVSRAPSSFGTAVFDEMRRSTVGILASHIRTIAGDVTDIEGREALAAAHRMLDRARVSLLAMDRLREPTDLEGLGAHDELVWTAVNLDIRYLNETDDWAASAALLERLAVPGADSMRRRLAEIWAYTARRHLAELLEHARTSTAADRRAGADVARYLLDRAQFMLPRMRAYLGPDDELLVEFQDAVATRATYCLADYFNQTGDLDAVEPLHARIQPLPLGIVAKKYVADQTANLARLRGRRDDTGSLENICWFCRKEPKDAGSSLGLDLHRDMSDQLGGTSNWRFRTVAVPRCAKCWEAHQPAARRERRAASAARLGGMTTIVGFFVGLVIHPAFIVGGVGLLVAIVASSADYGREIKAHAYTFPTVVELMAKGWIKGKRSLQQSPDK